MLCAGAFPFPRSSSTASIWMARTSSTGRPVTGSPPWRAGSHPRWWCPGPWWTIRPRPRRSWTWRWPKVKRAHTLALVVLAAEWGHGRRRGWLSNLHLGARDPQSGGFVMLGKTFKGMTDQLLAWQTERLQQLETRRDASTVYVRPELVVEVAFDGVQASTR